jgi:hypothetical protein
MVEVELPLIRMLRPKPSAAVDAVAQMPLFRDFFGTFSPSAATAAAPARD